MHFQRACNHQWSFSKFNDCHFSRQNDGLVEDFRNFCCCRSRGCNLVLIYKFCKHIWQRETDSKLISTEYKGLIVGYKLPEILDGSIVSAIHQILTLRLLVNDFGLKLLEYDTCNAELCECGQYDTNEHFICCQRINRRAYRNVMIEEEMPFSLVSPLSLSLSLSLSLPLSPSSSSFSSSSSSSTSSFFFSSRLVFMML